MSTFCIYASDTSRAAGYAQDLRGKGMRAMVRDARTFGGAKDCENCDIVVLLDGDYPEVAAAYEGRAHILSQADLAKAAKAAAAKKEKADDGDRTEDAAGKPGRHAAPADGAEDGDDAGEADHGEAGADAQPGEGEVLTRRRPRRARK